MGGKPTFEDLPSVWPGLEVHRFETCTASSQDLARKLHRPGTPCLVVCEEILNARGRLGRRWYAPKGGLWFTLALGPLRLENPWLLALAGGLSVAKALTKLAGVEARIKWPNDVLVGGKKVAGVLLEASQLEEGLELLLGVGVNVSNPLPSELRATATTLLEETGKAFDPQALLVEILRELRGYLSLLAQPRSESIISEVRALSATIGRRVRVALPGGGEVKGYAVDVDSLGRLIVKTEDDRVVVLEAGDVEHLFHEAK